MTITIRRITPKDAAAMACLMSDPAVFGGLLRMPYPTEELWQQRLGEGGAPGTPDLSLVAELSGEVVGSAGLYAPGLALRALPTPRLSDRRHVQSLCHA